MDKRSRQPRNVTHEAMCAKRASNGQHPPICDHELTEEELREHFAAEEALQADLLTAQACEREVREAESRASQAAADERELDRQNERDAQACEETYRLSIERSERITRAKENDPDYWDRLLKEETPKRRWWE